MLKVWFFRISLKCTRQIFANKKIISWQEHWICVLISTYFRNLKNYLCFCRTILDFQVTIPIFSPLILICKDTIFTTMTLFCRLFYKLEYIFRLLLWVSIVECFAQVCWENKDFGYFNFCAGKRYSVFSETRQSLPRLGVEHWDVVFMFL